VETSLRGARIQQVRCQTFRAIIRNTMDRLQIPTEVPGIGLNEQCVACYVASPVGLGNLGRSVTCILARVQFT
jgi:hypothetical protein